MAGQAKVNVGGVWRQVKNIFANVGGVWRQVKYSYANVGGVWRSAYQAIYALFTAGVQNVPYTLDVGSYGTVTNTGSSLSIYGCGDDRHGSSVYIRWNVDVTGYKTFKVDMDFTIVQGGGSCLVGTSSSYTIISTSRSRSTVNFDLTGLTGVQYLQIYFSSNHSTGSDTVTGNVYNVWLE
ncbi:hypothetical protein [Clostridium sp. OS1-26]|uniref:hypothetical protein n=1 Tax=Clostridium sp. OS1-26 TaxID=3070681 RepID=UPI0027DEC603|nr:hypothetical protein [Clostridium sp. OS1-26]WML35939.1 hypothetical protein RCG18_04110 [Clostridium sp. OS1-26]